jgi:hypothetical protein
MSCLSVALAQQENAARDKNGSYLAHEAEVNDMAGRKRSDPKDAARHLKT